MEFPQTSFSRYFKKLVALPAKYSLALVLTNFQVIILLTNCSIFNLPLLSTTVQLSLLLNDTSQITICKSDDVRYQNETLANTCSNEPE
ncbi:hypothetical protein V1478_015437 [Vespula squamosa]|uniref:Uncharacterized protein n=1 Tax=Vespula squamosa TaxID=30214 RepID=A0ABD2A529_VESSQ